MSRNATMKLLLLAATASTTAQLARAFQIRQISHSKTVASLLWDAPNQIQTAAIRPRSVPLLWSFSSTAVVDAGFKQAVDDEASNAASKRQLSKRRSVPVTLLAGFLGSGKTSAIQHLLSNTNNLKIGVIVNDVASVNIDAKLLKSSSLLLGDGNSGGEDPTDRVRTSTTTTNQANWIELQNGCVCCSIQDEWTSAMETLLLQQQTDKYGTGLDAIVVELSGVADPLALQSQWVSSSSSSSSSAVASSSLPVDLTFRIVTLVDACTFGTDYYTWDLVLDRPKWRMTQSVDTDEPTEYALDFPDGRRKVSELLAEQVEAAHAILVNKMDLASSMQSTTAMTMVCALNPTADVTTSEFGRISPSWILGRATVELDDATINQTMSASTGTIGNISQSRSNVLNQNGKDETSSNPSSYKLSNHHNHNGNVGHEDDDHETSCATTCTDPSHNHHEKSPPAFKTTVQNLGIASFVYKATRPFDTMRLRVLLNQWPVPVFDILELKEKNATTADAESIAFGNTGPTGHSVRDGPFNGILRSKGFCWTAPQFWSGVHSDAWRHDTAMYWSHAGRQMGISTAGKWWATIPDDKMQSYFSENRKEYDRIQAEDFQTDEFGDRRQEIVFIGTQLNQELITVTLDECLCNDLEMETYRQKLRNFMDARFSSTGSTSSPGLFGISSLEHTDL